MAAALSISFKKLKSRCEIASVSRSRAFSAYLLSILLHPWGIERLVITSCRYDQLVILNLIFPRDIVFRLRPSISLLILDKRILPSVDGLGCGDGGDDLVLEVDVFRPGVVIVYVAFRAERLYDISERESTGRS